MLQMSSYKKATKIVKWTVITYIITFRIAKTDRMRLWCKLQIHCLAQADEISLIQCRMVMQNCQNIHWIIFEVTPNFLVFGFVFNRDPALSDGEGRFQL